MPFFRDQRFTVIIGHTFQKSLCSVPIKSGHICTSPWYRSHLVGLSSLIQHSFLSAHPDTQGIDITTNSASILTRMEGRESGRANTETPNKGTNEEKDSYTEKICFN